MVTTATVKATVSTPAPTNKTAKIGLRRCPFCRKWDSMSIIPIKTNGFKITCDYSKGGCGASGGMGKTKEEAIRMWNLRTPIDHLRHDISEKSYHNSLMNCEVIPSTEIYEALNNEQEKYLEINI